MDLHCRRQFFIKSFHVSSQNLLYEIIEFCQWDYSTCFPMQFLVQEFPQYILRLKNNKIDLSLSFKKTHFLFITIPNPAQLIKTFNIDL